VPVPELERPQRLKPGDRVAVVSPSGPVRKDRLDAGCAVLRSWGLDVVLGAHVLDVEDRFEYLAGTDADRASDLQWAWLDPGISAVFCARGGYGAHRMVDLLDWSAMAEVRPKVLAGFSDITALHEAFAVRLGVATLHAPTVASPQLENEISARSLRGTLFDPETSRVLTSRSASTLVPGVASGVTVGGCLALLADNLGTPTARLGVDGGVLILEDTREDRYRLDRMLTQLSRAGWLDGVAGIALGSWVDCEAGVRDLMLDRLGALDVPIVWELGFGHGPISLTVPLGVAATLDADAATLTFDMPALA
jgi:muramoyltetrapeptide carboxypeptidase